jgi:acyl-CoA dehydrogenase
MLLGPGRGFEIAQGRLGPGRIHHCMRTVGTAERALSALIFRARHRVAFKERLDRKDTVRQAIAEARIEIAKCRQLCYLAACMCDVKGFKGARQYIAMIKVAAPRMALKIVDEAMQVHGGHGVSQYSKLSDMWRQLRTIRIADGPDIVHLNTVAKMEIARAAHHDAYGADISGINPNIEKYGKYKHVRHLTHEGISKGVRAVEGTSASVPMHSKM